MHVQHVSSAENPLHCEKPSPLRARRGLDCPAKPCYRQPICFYPAKQQCHGAECQLTPVKREEISRDTRNKKKTRLVVTSYAEIESLAEKQIKPCALYNFALYIDWHLHDVFFLFCFRLISKQPKLNEWEERLFKLRKASLRYGTFPTTRKFRG